MYVGSTPTGSTGSGRYPPAAGPQTQQEGKEGTMPRSGVTLSGETTLDEPTTFQKAFAIEDHVRNVLLVDRQHKYGPGNIAAFGELGLLVRMSDKLERLKHLHSSGGPGDFADETVEDTLRDIANYAMIWLVYRSGWWGLPLEGSDDIGTVSSDLSDGQVAGSGEGGR